MLTPLRLCVALVVCLGLTMPLSAPAAAQSSSSDASDTTEKVWIFLIPRPNVDSDVAVSASPLDGVHPAALHRRSRRGTPDADATRPVAYLDALTAAGVTPLVRSRWLHAVSARLAPDAQRRVAALPVVRAIRPVRRGTVTAFPNRPARLEASPTSEAASPSLASLLAADVPLDPAPSDSSFYGASYTQLRLMNALAPLQRGINGRGVRIGYLDSRYRGFRHPTFDALKQEDRLVATRDFAGGNQISNHGGWVASTTVGYTPGLLIGSAYKAHVLAASTEDTRFERNVEEDNFIAGMEWMERRGADVVNVSLGYARFDEGERSYTVDDLDGDTAVTTRAADAAVQLGMAVVVSAGNSGCDDPDGCWYYVGTPADGDSVITVGGVGPDSSRIGFSSRGPTADGRIKPDVAAMGGQVVGAWGEDEYSRVNGTSFASPLVTGVVAQMLQVNPDLSPMDIRTILRSTASQADAPDNDLGWGIVNADAAVREAERRARSAPPAELVVSTPYPNPARTTVTLPIDAPKTAEASLTFYDVLGRQRLRRTRLLQAGPNRVSLSVDALPTGMYLYRVEAGAFAATGRLAVVR